MMAATQGLNGAAIALTCSGLNHVPRGVEAWTEQAFAALRRRDVSVTLFQGSGDRGTPGVRIVPCIRRGSPLSRRLSRLLPPFGWRLGFGSPYQMEQTTFALAAFWALARRFDLVHTKDPQVAAILQQARRMGVSRARVILNHGTEEPPAFLKRFDYIQHLAPAHLEQARAEGVRAKRQFAIPNFVETGTFAPGSGAAFRARHGIPREALVVLCVAAVKRHHKRVDWLLEEAARVPAVPGQPVHVVIAGARTDETDELVRLGEALLGGRARFLFDQPREQMPELYRAADLFVLCSLKEMLANALLEALASGLPCVMHREPVAEWAIGGGGETIDLRQPGTLAGAIQRYRDSGLRAAAGRRARERAVQAFAADVVLEQQLAMYRDVLSDAGRGNG